MEPEKQKKRLLTVPLSHFYKRSKVESKPSKEHEENVTTDQAAPAALEETCPAPGPSKEVEDRQFYKNDIANYVDCMSKYTTGERLLIRDNIWQPGSNYKFHYETTKKFNRHFQYQWLLQFKWLAYSDRERGAYCKTCCLFFDESQGKAGKGKHQALGSFVKTPFTRLKDALEQFRLHEKTQYHRATLLVEERLEALSKQKVEGIDVLLDTKKKKEILENRERLMVIIDGIRHCGIQGNALRGTSDSGRIELKTPDYNDGNFRALIRHTAKYNDKVREGLEVGSGNAMYTSPQIQNEIISIFAETIQKKIKEKLGNGYFSVLADETADISQIEQFSLCIRYVERDEENYLFTLREDFLEFVPVLDQTGNGLAKVIQDRLRELCIDINRLRGQGYDGASAMSGVFRGVQALILEKYPLALYTHCLSHNLNLCLSDASKVREIQKATGVIKEVCSHFHRSAQRTSMLQDSLKVYAPFLDNTRLRSMCETRWCERHEAVLLFKESFKAIYAALRSLNDKKSMNLVDAFENFSFIVSVHALAKLLSITYPLSLQLQTKDLDLVEALSKVKSTRIILEKIRKDADAEFNALYKEAVEMFVKTMEVAENVDNTVPRIIKMQTCRENYETKNVESYYRTSIFVPFIDDLISSLTERFLSQETTISSLQYILPKKCSVSFNIVQPCFEFYSADLPFNSVDVLKGEWLLWQQKWEGTPNKEKPTTAIEALQCTKNFPSMAVLLEILCVLPVTTASTERTFSTLRVIKNYLRNSTKQDRLTGLALMSIHRPIVNSIENDEVLDSFTLKKRRIELTL